VIQPRGEAPVRRGIDSSGQLFQDFKISAAFFNFSKAFGETGCFSSRKMTHITLLD
jgi:hypothetical protein